MINSFVTSSSHKMTQIRILFAQTANKLNALCQDSPYDLQHVPALFQCRHTKAFCFNVTQNFKLIKSISVNKIEAVLCNVLLNNPNENRHRPLKARRFSLEIIKVLEQSFNKNPYPSDEEKMILGRRCRITLKQVANWFTNKRNRQKIQIERRRLK